MIVDLRIYEAKPNRVAEFVAIYKQHGWPLQQKYLGRCIGWYVGLEGNFNRVVHLWAYDSQADREQRREALRADPAWADYLRRVAAADLLVRMENHIVAPTDFSPLP